MAGVETDERPPKLKNEGRKKWKRDLYKGFQETKVIKKPVEKLSRE